MLRLVFGVGIGATAIYLAARDLSWSDLSGVLAGIRWGWALLAVVIAFAGQTVKAIRWRLLLSGEPDPPPLWTAWIFHLSGQLGNILFPGPVGDVGRILVVGGRWQGRMFTAGTVALEKVTDLIAYSLIVLALVAGSQVPDWITSSAAGLVALAAAVGLTLVLAVLLRVRLGAAASAVLARLPFERGRRLKTGLQAAAAGWKAAGGRGRLLRLAFATALIWTASILVNHTMTQAFGLALPLSASVLLLVLLQAGVSTNLVPGTIGLFEYLCVRGLAIYDIPQPVAFGYGVALHVVVLIPLVAAAAAGALGGWRK